MHRCRIISTGRCPSRGVATATKLKETISIPSPSAHGLRLPTPKQWSPPSSSFLRGQPLCEPTPTPPGSIPKTTTQWTASLQPPLCPTRSLPQPTPPAKQPHNLLQLQPGPSRNNSSTKNHQTSKTSPATTAASTPSHTTPNNLNDRRCTYKQEPRVQSRNPLRVTKLYPASISPKLQRLNGAQKAKTTQGRNSKADVKVIQARPTRFRKAIFIPSTLSVATLAKLMNIKLEYLQMRMRRVGMAEEANYDHILTSDYAVLLAEELGFKPVVDDEAAFDIYAPPPHPNPSSLPSRPPIVTIMGHVDHGKTTLLDTLRSASVAKGEAGGITQHIGAFSVPVKNQSLDDGPMKCITFLDTPGHAAFSAMRARGADVTDIVVLVVAADDGIMPQTKEVINLIQKEGAQISLVVAINKMDKPGSDAESVKLALMTEGVQLEEFGGDVPAVQVSGLTGEGLGDLVEILSTVAEVQDLRAEQTGPAQGHVIESNLHKGLGPVATVLIRRGCLRTGSCIISGLAQGKVRRMTDSNGKTVPMALPGMAITVSGWKTLPKAGDEVLEASETDLKKALANRIRKAETEALHEDIDAINSARRHDRESRLEGADPSVLECITASGPTELKLMIKADVSGSGEALEGALNGIGNDIAVSKVISTGVGDITESDVMMAKAANATLLGFSVSVPRSIRSIAAQNEVSIATSDIIYRLVEDVRSRIVALLPTIKETRVTGEADVLQIFEIQLKGHQKMKVAGCRVINGLVQRNKFARVVRSGQIIHEGSLDTMRQLKKEVTEVRKGTECGLSFKGFSDLQAGDVIQMYDKIEKPGVI